MSLEIRSIGEVISYQSIPRTEFVVGIGIVESKTNENENITFNIVQFFPVDVETPCYVTSLAPKDVIYFYGTVTNVDSSTQTINVTCSHSRKISLDPSSLPHDFTYVTAVGTIAGKPNITETTVSFDVSLSQFVKTNTGGAYQPFTITVFHSTKNKHLLNRTKVYNIGSRIKIEGAVELYKNTIYCELQHSTFVIPKSSTTTTNDTSSPVSPSSSRRAAIVRNIAEHSPSTKKPKLVDSTTSLSSTIASESESSTSMQVEDDTNSNEDVLNNTQPKSIKSNKKTSSNTSKSRRATLRDLSSRKLA
jgi:hypothetical protein